ncbi:MAG: hypothetical protein ACR2HR_10245 [Euzebya sp.]
MAGTPPRSCRRRRGGGLHLVCHYTGSSSGGAVAAVDNADVSASWPAVRDRVQQVLDDRELAEKPYDGYFGPTTPEQTLDTFYSSDLLVHTWDLATATGLAQFESMPPDVIAHCHAELAELPEEAIRSEGIYGPALEVDDDADQQEKFLAFIGRRSG